MDPTPLPSGAHEYDEDRASGESTTGSPDATSPSPGTGPRAVRQPSRPRGPMIAALAVIAVMVLTVGIGGSILVYRALAPGEEPEGGAGSAATGPAVPGGDDGSPHSLVPDGTTALPLGG